MINSAFLTYLADRLQPVIEQLGEGDLDGSEACIAAHDALRRLAVHRDEKTVSEAANAWANSNQRVYRGPKNAAIEAFDTGAEWQRGQPVEPTSCPPLLISCAVFALELLRGGMEGGSFDGGDIQEIGVRCGLLITEERLESCGEGCACATYAGFPATCYRIVPELLPSTPTEVPADGA